MSATTTQAPPDTQIPRGSEPSGPLTGRAVGTMGRLWAHLAPQGGGEVAPTAPPSLAGPAVRVTAQVFLGIAIGAVGIGQVLAAPNATAAALLVAVTVAVAVLWWATTVAQRLPAVLLPAAAAAAMGVTFVVPFPAGQSIELAFAWLLIASTAAGFLLAPLWSRLVIITATASALAAVALTVAPTDAATIAGASLRALDTFTTGMALTAALAALAAAMRRFHQSTHDYQEQVMATRVAAEWAEHASATAVLLHNTAVNTLGALGTGFATDVVALREQCGRDVEQITAWTAVAIPEIDVSAQFPAALVELVTDRAATLGLPVTVDVQCPADQGVTVDAEVAAAVNDVVTAALSAAAGRPQVSAVAVTLTGSAAVGTMVLVDDGAGPSLAAMSEETVRRARLAGLHVQTRTGPGTEMSVRLEWADVSKVGRDDMVGSPVRLADIVTDVLPVMLVRIWLWMGVLYGVALALRGVLAPGVALGPAAAALGLAAAVCTGALVAARAGARQTWWAVVAVTVMIPLVTALPAVGLSGCARFGPLFWQVNIAVLLVVFVVWLSPSKALTVLACVGFVAPLVTIFGLTPAGGCTGLGFASIVTAVVVICGAFLLRRHLSALARVSAASEAVRARSAAQAAQERKYAFIRRLRSRQALERAVALLTAIHLGVVDPGSTRVRQTARVEESYLRAGLAIPADLGPAGEQLVELLGRAARRGLRIRLTAAGAPDAQGQLCPQAVSGPATVFIDAAPTGTAVAIQVNRAPTCAAELVLVADGVVAGADSIGSGFDGVTVDHSGGQTRVVIRCPQAMSAQGAETCMG